MRRFLCACLLAATVSFAGCGRSAHAAPMPTANAHDSAFDPAFQLVFLSVLDGCFQDGLTDADVDQILLKTPKGAYVHFISHCPICTATCYALEAYRARPDAHTLKMGGRLAFGNGLTTDLHARLYSEQVKERLSAIHDLEQNWVDRRVTSLRLNAEETAQTQKELKDARDEGTRMLDSFVRQNALDWAAPGYHAGDECAVCNAATGMSLKLAPRD